jgi:hypothetical protein
MKLIHSNQNRFLSVTFRHRTGKGGRIRVTRLLRASAAPGRNLRDRSMMTSANRAPTASSSCTSTASSPSCR